MTCLLGSSKRATPFSLLGLCLQAPQAKPATPWLSLGATVDGRNPAPVGMDDVLHNGTNHLPTDAK